MKLRKQVGISDQLIFQPHREERMVFMFTHAAAMYIDPATTSLIIQIAAGVIITVGTFLGIFWSKIKRAFKKDKRNEAEAIDTAEINALHDGEKDVVTADDLLSDDDEN